MSRTRVSKEIIKEREKKAIEVYQKGDSLFNIARMCNLTITHVSKVLKENGKYVTTRINNRDKRQVLAKRKPGRPKKVLTRKKLGRPKKVIIDSNVSIKSMNKMSIKIEKPNGTKIEIINPEKELLLSILK